MIIVRIASVGQNGNDLPPSLYEKIQSYRGIITRSTVLFTFIRSHKMSKYLTSIFRTSSSSKHWVIPFLLIIVLCTTYACKDGNPIDGKNIEPGRRDYIWTADTLYLPYNLFDRMTGTSPTDLWVSTPGGRLDQTLFHYDGMKWQTDGISRRISPRSVFSVSPNNVWSGGGNGLIWHYDGTTWSESYVRNYKGYTDIVFEDICASSPSDVYAVGARFDSSDVITAVISHFNGTSWSDIKIPEIRTNLAVIRYDWSGRGKYYILGFDNERFSPSTYQLYEFDGQTLKEITSGLQNQDSFGNIAPLGKSIYFVIGFTLYKYEQNTLQYVHEFSHNSNFGNSAIGRSEKDIFIRMRDGLVHYNGTNEEYLLTFASTNIDILGWKLFDKNIFVLARDYARGNNILFRGTLKD